MKSSGSSRARTCSCPRRSRWPKASSCYGEPMKVMTVLGTRPEIIRLSRVIPKLDAICEHVLVHTGQNFDPALSDVFFRDLGVREPDRSLGVRADSFGEQAGQILAGVERAIMEEKPDRLLILGDTNSGLSAVIAKR